MNSKLIVIIAFLLLCAATSFAQNPDFIGTWVLNFEKSKLEDNSDALTKKVFVIQQKADQFKLTIKNSFGSREKSISFKMRPEGRTRRIKVLLKGNLEWKGNSLLASLWRKNFSNIVEYKFGNNQNELIADEVFKGKNEGHHNIWVFERK